MTTRLHHALPTAGRKHNKYCGPAAIAAITGVTTGDAAQMLRQAGGRRAIRGTYTDEMLTVLGWCGHRVIETESHYPHKSMTLRNWIKDRWNGDLVLVEAMNHWWAMADGFFCDSWNRIPQPVDKIHNPKCQVAKVYFLE